MSAGFELSRPKYQALYVAQVGVQQQPEDKDVPCEVRVDNMLHITQYT